MKKIVPKLIMIFGLVIIVGSISLKIYSKNLENKAVNRFEQKIEEKVEIGKINIGDEIAIIDIPSIGINTVIVHGIENKYLSHYVCHFENTAMPGANGNFAVAGHSSFRYNEVFNDLHKANVGDKINIKTLNEKFTYIITEIFETDPENIEVLNQNNDIKEMTIVTCSNGGADRLIVKALIEEQ